MLLTRCPPSSWAPDHLAGALGDICIWRAHLQCRILEPDSVTSPPTLPTLLLPPTPSASSISHLDYLLLLYYYYYIITTIMASLVIFVILFYSFLSFAISVPIAMNGNDVSGSRSRPSLSLSSAPIARPGLASLRPLFSPGSALLK